ncbi:MAG: hypothetical protein HYZ13_07715 [Acidobacteria bacterium]|nr:hypothetical protein [Acidobacteriota bacterium]
MENSYSTPTSDVSNSKGKPWGKWIGFGCLGAVALMLLMGMSCYFMVSGAMKVGEKEFGPVCSQYLAKLESKDFAGAYSLMGQGGRNAFPEEKHNKLMKGITEKLGPIESKTVQFVQTGVDQTGRWGRITYATKFRNGSGTIRFELRKTTDEYQVVGVFFQSPLLTDYVNETLSKEP